MNRRQAITALGCLAAFPAATPSTADLRGDMAILRQALALHPGLYRYASPREIDARLDRLERAFVAAPTRAERYLALSRFLASIRCGHSWCNFLNQSDAVSAELFDRRTRLPFRFRWIDRRMIVTADPTATGLAPGTEVVTVDGTPASHLLAKLLPFARADGGNDAKRIALLGVAGTETIETFDAFHGLLFGAPSGGIHRITVRDPSGRTRSLQTEAIGLAARQRQKTVSDTSGDAPAWQWALRPDGIAVLTMPTWALYESKWNWRAWLADRLAALRGAKGLIVDLRENEGGQDCGDALLACLTDRPIAPGATERRVRFTRSPATLDPFLSTWDRSFRTLGVGAVPIAPGWWRLAGEHADDRIVPAAPRLTCPVAALVGPTNSSATFQFAAKARDSGLVRLFGATTGGNRRGINGGAFFFVRLPASGIVFDLPLIGYFPAGQQPDAGVVPDVHVEESAADIAAGFDRTLATATRWIIAAS